MPNVIVSLTQEIARVRALLPSLEWTQRRAAEEAIGFAEYSKLTNSLAGMTESLSELREFTAEPKK